MKKAKKLQKPVITLLFIIILAALVNVMGINIAEASAMPKISEFPYQIVIGGSSRIKLKGVPKGAKVTYKSSKKNVATVTGKGMVKGRKSGSTKITVFVRTKSMRVRLACIVSVEKPVLSNTALSLERGDNVKLSVKNKPKKARYSWYSSNPHAAKVNSKGKVTALDEGITTIRVKVRTSAKIYTLSCRLKVLPDGNKSDPSDNNAVETAKSYSYEIIPLLAPFNDFFYVKTENPNVENIRFADKESPYYTDDSIAYLALSDVSFLDVEYENKETGRVNDGYIFRSSGYGLDGGMLSLEVSSGRDYYGDQYGYREIGVQVQCDPVKESDQYLVDTYTDPNASLFDNLDSVQAALNSLAVYTLGIRKPAAAGGVLQYPFLAASYYPELDLNEYYDIYQESEEKLFSYYLYPYRLDSLDFPSMMWSAAQLLDPTCTLGVSSVHYGVVICSGEVSRLYGGAGAGNSYANGMRLFSSSVSKAFFFDGREGDCTFNSTLDSLYESFWYYDNQAVTDFNEIVSNYSLRYPNGVWLRTVSEPMISVGGVTEHVNIVYAYSDYEDVWVDGRYLNKWNYWEKGAAFADHSTSDIVKQNMEYTTKYGESRVGDAVYYYDEDYGVWLFTGSGYDKNDYEKGLMPDEFVLTMDELPQMSVDSKTDITPEHGLVYDGSLPPGTAF